ncbi:MAG TPA: alpha/beta hydrolase, partial [Planctomycetaceae bacterium]|nr:alpha/beta hydrolase [Planctomycetaceae bacterium]
MAGHYVTTDEGLHLYCETRGDGAEALVFPNGLMMKDDFAWLAGDRTLVFYDPRHRGRSDAAGDARAARGIHDDVDDLEAVRRYFGFEKMALFGHSYVGVMVALYAMTRPARVSRVIQMSPAEPYPGKAYPAHLT